MLYFDKNLLIKKLFSYYKKEIYFLAFPWLHMEVRRNETVGWPSCFYQALMHGDTEDTKKQQRILCGWGRKGWFGKVEFEVHASQNTQSKLKKTTEIEHIYKLLSIYLGVFSIMMTTRRDCRGKGKMKRGELKKAGGVHVVSYKFPSLGTWAGWTSWPLILMEQDLPLGPIPPSRR